jgi:hypothetical protein
MAERTYYIAFVDGKTRLFHAIAADFFRSVERWRQQDLAYIRGELPEAQWKGFTEFMILDGFVPIAHVKVRVGG